MSLDWETELGNQSTKTHINYRKDVQITTMTEMMGRWEGAMLHEWMGLGPLKEKINLYSDN